MLPDLPPAFQEEMKQLFFDFSLTAQWPDFLASFARPSARGLRANPQKITRPALRLLLQESSGRPAADFASVPWSDQGLYYPADLAPGKLPFHAAGLYYIQEPSAMLPAQVLAARPGELVLDLCAAPGGKASQISGDLQGRGLLWANDISAQRVKALKLNLELAGAKNALVSQLAPSELAQQLTGAFDAILADVPCSASAMFRRTPATLRNWTRHRADYPKIQKEILQAAWRMLRPGGRLVYSTCSFSLAENELMIDWFCRQQPDCLLLPINKTAGVADGLAVTEQLRQTARIWPQQSQADGHFCALLQKKGKQTAALSKEPARPASGPAWAAFLAFCRANCSEQGQSTLEQLFWQSHKLEKNGHLHLLPAYQLPPGLQYVMLGLYLGQARPGGGFTPSYSLLLSLGCQDLAYQVTLAASNDLLRRCLAGESLVLPADLASKNWPVGARLALTLKQGQGCWPLSWARLAENDLLKNDLPAYLRNR